MQCKKHLRDSEAWFIYENLKALLVLQEILVAPHGYESKQMDNISMRRNQLLNLWRGKGQTVTVSPEENEGMLNTGW